VNSAALAAVIAAATSVIVTTVSLFVGDRQQRRRERQGERRDLDRRYLNPLRFHLVENHFRLTLLTRRSGDRRLAESSLSVQRPDEVSGKDAAWFNGRGCALISSVYLTACLFAQLKKVREEFPFLSLSGTDDTRLAALVLRVHRAFVGGVYYVTQPSIGESMWTQNRERLITYREFCGHLTDPDWRAWVDGLIVFHLETARGEKEWRSQAILDAIGELSAFLDECVGGGRSIESRLEAEGLEPER
jgi:hypothetical protein